MYVCLCRAVTESAVKAMGRAGLVSEADLIDVMRLEDDACCGHCLRNIEALAELAQEGALETLNAADAISLRSL
jgi:bacterioferritin-associated ferredoxin